VVRVSDWLLESDPAVRWQVLRDLLRTPAEAVAAERARVAAEGWGARLLARQGADGQWAGGACFPAEGWRRDRGEGQPWTSTLPTLELLCAFGVDPRDDRVRRAIAQVRDRCRWEHAGQPFFGGEVEPCINGRTVGLGSYFDQDVAAIVDRLVGEQLEDGGWNCEAENGSTRSSFATTINVLEGLLAHERAGRATPPSIAARRRGEAYLLERRLFRRKRTGEVVNPAWLQFSFPTRWRYDVLRALDYFRSTGRRRTRAPTKRSPSSDRSSSPMAPGCSRTRIPARSTSRSRTATAAPADGTRCGRCVSSPGTSGHWSRPAARATQRSRGCPGTSRESRGRPQKSTDKHGFDTDDPSWSFVSVFIRVP